MFIRYGKKTVIVLTVTVALLVAFSFGTNLSAQSGFGRFDEGSEQQLADISVYFSTSAAEPGSLHRAVAEIAISSGWHINSSKPHADWLIPAQVTVDTVAGLVPQRLVYPTGVDASLAGEMMSVYDGRVRVYFDVAVAENATDGEYSLPVRLDYQACNDRECRPPQEITASLKIRIGTGGEPVHENLFVDTPVTTEIASETAPVGDETEFEKLINEGGVWGYFLALGLAFVTGLLLSFSPCTYPMVPITVSIFAGQDRSMGKGFVLSLFYVGSMATMYGIMGLIVSLVGGVFGAWLASPPVVIGIAVVFVVFALSMFGLYNLDVPWSIKQRLGARNSSGGIFGVMVLGVVAALVVSPCVGPFVAGILLWVATYGSPFFGFLLLFVFALGLGTLYVIIGTFSSAINSLPGAGEWMETVKKFFGFVLLLMALYFLRTILSPTWIALLTGLLLVAFAVFSGGLDRLTSESGFFDRLKKFLGILALLLGIYLLGGTILKHGFILPGTSGLLSLAGGDAVAEETDLIDWQSDLALGLEKAAASGKPVLIDTWATWCVNCKVLDKKTFRQPEVAAEAERFVALKVQLEEAGSETTREFMNRFGLKQFSLPTVLLLGSDGSVQRVLQGVVGPEDMIDEMKKVR